MKTQVTYLHMVYFVFVVCSIVFDVFLGYYYCRMYQHIVVPLLPKGATQGCTAPLVVWVAQSHTQLAEWRYRCAAPIYGVSPSFYLDHFGFKLHFKCPFT